MDHYGPNIAMFIRRNWDSRRTFDASGKMAREAQSEFVPSICHHCFHLYCASVVPENSLHAVSSSISIIPLYRIKTLPLEASWVQLIPYCFGHSLSIKTSIDCVQHLSSSLEAHPKTRPPPFLQPTMLRVRLPFLLASKGNRLLVYCRTISRPRKPCFIGLF